MKSEKIVSFVTERINDWETGSSEFFGFWNEWAGHYEMKYQDKDPRPYGIAKNVTAEIPSAVNSLATTITRMQTTADPPFELRTKNQSVSEQQIYDMEITISKALIETQFKRSLLKGNRGMCLFGSQVWEKQLMRTIYGGEYTHLIPISLLESAYDTNVYTMDESDYFARVTEVSSYRLRNLYNNDSSLWDGEEIERAIDKMSTKDSAVVSKSTIEARRSRAGFSEFRKDKHKLVFYNGRLSKDLLDLPEFQEMWVKFNRTDDPKHSDITIAILDDEFIIRFHPTPYGTWRWLYDIGNYVEMELEPLGHGVGSSGAAIQNDLNRIMRNVTNVEKFSLFTMFLSGRGGGFHSNSMNVFPFAVHQVDDISQVTQIKPAIEAIPYGLKIAETLREDLRNVTNASSALQAILTGATATETTLAQNSAIRNVSLIAEVNSDCVIRPYLRTLIRNLVDQNPYDNNIVDLDIDPKTTTDKDYKPEYTKKMLDWLNFLTSVRNTVPLDVNVMPVIEYISRSFGVPPRLLKQPRPQVDRNLDILRRMSQMGGATGSQANEVNSEIRSSGLTPGNPIPSAEVPSPVSGVLGAEGVPNP